VGHRKSKADSGQRGTSKGKKATKKMPKQRKQQPQTASNATKIKAEIFYRCTASAPQTTVSSLLH
jgi:hypothetical protein